MSKEIILDVHELPPPEPLDLTLEVLGKLKQGEYVKMMHCMQPFPLYDTLLENGLRYAPREGMCGFDIYIWYANDWATGSERKNGLSLV